MRGSEECDWDEMCWWLLYPESKTFAIIIIYYWLALCQHPMIDWVRCVPLNEEVCAVIFLSRRHLKNDWFIQVKSRSVIDQCVSEAFIPSWYKSNSYWQFATQASRPNLGASFYRLPCRPWTANIEYLPRRVRQWSGNISGTALALKETRNILLH